MSTRDLAAKYGKSKNSTQLINAAIRMELPGGGAALELLALLRQTHDWRPTRESQAALDLIRRLVDAMADEIRRRYDLPLPEDG